MKSTKDKIIHINNEWAVVGDENNVVLFKKRIVERTGKVQYDPKGYFQNYEHLLHRFVDMEIQPLNNIKLIVERIDELKKYITNLFQRLSQNPSQPNDKDFEGNK